MYLRSLLGNCSILLLILGSFVAQGPASSGTRLHLNGLDPRVNKQERDVSALLLPTRERWHGPVDLDVAAAARAYELNRTWMESPGGCDQAFC